MGPKAGRKPAEHLVPEAPIVYDGSGASRLHSKKPSFQEWKLFMVIFLTSSKRDCHTYKEGLHVLKFYSNSYRHNQELIDRFGL